MSRSLSAYQAPSGLAAKPTTTMGSSSIIDGSSLQPERTHPRRAVTAKVPAALPAGANIIPTSSGHLRYLLGAAMRWPKQNISKSPSTMWDVRSIWRLNQAVWVWASKSASAT